jgi:RNA-directed DNA polymerase
MKRLGDLWNQVVSFDNLLLAYRKARRGKGRSAPVARFALDLERELLRLQRELKSGEYRPGGYRLFTIYERKPRVIAAAPFRDRVVHHAVMNLIEPPLDRTFIDDSYACRRGKGVHAAVDRYQGWSRRYAYALKLDVRQYFPFIDHPILKEKLRRRLSHWPTHPQAITSTPVQPGAV